MAAKKTAQPAIQSEPQEPQGRVYNNEVHFDSDLFRLDNAFLLKNTQWNTAADPEYVKHEHSHWFHTFDSDGRAQEQSIERGGHFHVMTVTKRDGQPPIVECSVPMKWVRNKRGQKYATPLGDFDQHVHEVKYVRSHRLKMRQANAEAAKVHAAEAQKEAFPSGIRPG